MNQTHSSLTLIRGLWGQQLELKKEEEKLQPFRSNKAVRVHQKVMLHMRKYLLCLKLVGKLMYGELTVAKRLWFPRKILVNSTGEIATLFCILTIPMIREKPSSCAGGLGKIVLRKSKRKLLSWLLQCSIQ